MAIRPNPVIPKEGEESVWDYPRPPKLEKVGHHVRIVFGGEVIVDSHDTYRVLETSHPPVYYIPPADILKGILLPSRKTTHCEWKGEGNYYHIQVKDHIAKDAAWYYHHPTPAFEAVKDFVAFYPDSMDACYVNDEKITPQPGAFYGGWITKNIVGPFKGGPDSWGW